MSLLVYPAHGKPIRNASLTAVVKTARKAIFTTVETFSGDRVVDVRIVVGVAVRDTLSLELWEESAPGLLF